MRRPTARARLLAVSLVVPIGLGLTGCGGGGGDGSTDPSTAPSTSAPTSTAPPSTDAGTPGATTSDGGSSPAAPGGPTLTAKFAGGLGQASITVPSGFKRTGGFANTQQTARTASGDESVDLVLAPAGGTFPPSALAKIAAADIARSSGKRGVIHQPLTAAGTTFAYVTGQDGTGGDIATFAVNVALTQGYGGISVQFTVPPSVSQADRTALYQSVLSSLSYR